MAQVVVHHLIPSVSNTTIWFQETREWAIKWLGSKGPILKSQVQLLPKTECDPNPL